MTGSNQEDLKARLRATLEASQESRRKFDLMAEKLQDQLTRERIHWVREAALRLMTSLAVPMEQMGPAQWSHATVATADAIWQKAVARAQEGQGEK